MEIFISTGEVSGDLQAAQLAAALQQQTPGQPLTLSGIGGERMAAVGVSLVAQSSAIAAFGIQESLPMLFPSLRLMRQAQTYLRQHRPDVVVLVDYEGFNLNLGTFVKTLYPDVPIVYYIAPQYWVSCPFPSKIKTILAISDRFLAIFPEEARFFANLGANVVWLGHPLIDRIQTAPDRATARQQLGIAPTEIAIALLPASRPQELKLLLPQIFAAAQHLQAQLAAVRFWIPLSTAQFKGEMQDAIAHYQLNATLVEQDSLTVLAAADLAIAKCGTVSLELALLNIPQVVVYRLHGLTMWLARHVLKMNIRFAAPPNLLLMEAVVPELLQEAASVDNIVRESWDLLTNPTRRDRLFQDYQRMRQEIGEVGVCDRAAREILTLLPQPEIVLPH